ncbi:MAG: GTPase ObgE [Tissierellia bacterium]|nr:GTPase ObgE [Tissierellia bacterium]
MFIDVAKIDLKAGKGGDGAISFRREKYEPSGGPYGGDGGNGGSIIIVADEGIRTLMDFRYKRHYKAENGENGKTKKMYGKAGEDLYLKVPIGTLIKDYDTDAVMYDLKEDGEQFVVCKGGKGGRGNAKFATSTRQAPRFAEPGTLGEERVIKLELKLIADVGFIGLPNVGKSSILSIISEAKPKIANYHFTTLKPNLGVVKIGPEKSFVVADIPGLIEGASDGIGLGFDFLRHVERTKILVHVLDASGSESRDPVEDYYKIREEIEKYNIKLVDKKEIVVANKMDIYGADVGLSLIKEALQDKVEAIIPVSAATTEGIEDLKFAMWNIVKDIKHIDYETYDEEYIEFKEDNTPDYTVFRQNEFFIVEGPLIDNLVYRTNFDDNVALKHFQKVLRDKGVITKLQELGIENGDTVVVGELEFDYYA